MFISTATNLVAHDNNGQSDVFLYDRATGVAELITVSSSGVAADGGSEFPAVSADGRFVTYYSFATNLDDGDENGRSDVFLRDREAGTTTLISRARSGASGNAQSNFPDVSANGRWVAFASRATDLVRRDRNGPLSDVFRYEVATGRTTLISVSSTGEQSDGWSYLPQISDGGGRVAYSSTAHNLDLPSDGDEQIYLHDAHTGTTLTASRTRHGTAGDGYCEFGLAISGNGNKVAFTCVSSDLVKRDDNDDYDVFVFAPGTLRVRLASRSLEGGSADGWSDEPSLDRRGRVITFASSADDLSEEPEYDGFDIFRRPASG